MSPDKLAYMANQIGRFFATAELGIRLPRSLDHIDEILGSAHATRAVVAAGAQRNSILCRARPQNVCGRNSLCHRLLPGALPRADDSGPN